MKRYTFSLILLTFLFSSIVVPQVHRSPQITVDELHYHLKYIASDALEGRRAGSIGADQAAAYIAREFKLYGLQPMGDKKSFFQEFEFVAGVELGKKNQFTYSEETKKTALKLDQEMRPFGFSATGSFKGGIVFVGYGIAASEKEYDDYAGVDVKDKAVMILRHHPEGDNPNSDFGKYSGHRYKAAKAKELGAKAIILVTGPADSDKDELIRLSYDITMGNAGILAINLTQQAADELLKSSGLSVKSLQQELNTTKKPRSFDLKGIELNLEVDVREIRKKTKNVIGYLEGNDPVLKDEIIVIGAHHDHLGMGGENSGSLRPDTIAVHNGADDNGSGTVGLLELSQSFAARKNELKRSMLFIAFCAEEIGLLGSAHFVKNPTVNLGNVVTMINMDMIGRLTDRKLIVYGIGTSSEFESLVKKHNRDTIFSLKLNTDGFGPSDHSSFYGKNIPVFHFFTDIHPDYHRPSDDYDLINYDGMVNVLNYIQAIAFDLNQGNKRPLYVQVEAPRPIGGGRGARTYTGVIPDFGEQTDGMKISGVREGGPASKAGLQAGDIIKKFGKVEIKNLYDYTFALGEYKAGDEVEIVVKRGNETLTLKLILERRN